MKESFELKLKEDKAPTIWQRLLQWLNADRAQSKGPVQLLPKTGTQTDILLSQNQKLELKQAVEAPLERTSDTTSYLRKSDAGQDNQLII